MTRDEYDKRWHHFGGDVGRHCRDCEERHMGCHSDCEKYLEAKGDYDQRKEFIYEIKSKERAYKAYKYEKVTREIRSQDRKRSRHGINH